ncbi:hypothetical protein BCV00_11180 [Vibrio breoganii]|nr:hypothetical protein BCV00_11180 [Vibrio breoganii]
MLVNYSVRKKAMGCYFFTYFALNAYLQTVYYIQGHEWVYGDWFINYADGFVRRGLSGEIFLLGKDFVNPLLLAYVFKLAIFALFSYFTYDVIYKERELSSYLFFLFCPALFIFIIGAPSSSGRKEILFFALISYAVWREMNNKNTHLFLVIILVYPLFILSHEMLILTLPFLVYLWCKEVPDSVKKVYKIILMCTPSLLAFLACVYFNNADYDLIYNKVIDSNVQMKNGGAIEALSLSPEYFFKYLDRNEALNYIFYVPLSLMPLIFIMDRFSGQSWINSLLLLSPAIGFFLLAFVSIDWGRWINIYLMGLFYVSLTLGKSKDKSKNNSKIYYVALIFYGLVWTLPFYPVAL